MCLVWTFLRFGSGVEVRGQLSGIGSLFPTYGFWGSNSNFLEQAPLTLWATLPALDQLSVKEMSGHLLGGTTEACYLHFRYIFFSCSAVIRSQLLGRDWMWLTWGLGWVISGQASVTACWLLWWPSLPHTHTPLLFKEHHFYVNFLPKLNLKLLITETRDGTSKDQQNVFLINMFKANITGINNQHSIISCSLSLLLKKWCQISLSCLPSRRNPGAIMTQISKLQLYLRSNFWGKWECIKIEGCTQAHFPGQMPRL